MNEISSDPQFDPNIGAKFDGGKLRYDLIPPEAIAGYAEILTYGAEKYSDRNWEKGIDPDRIFAAMQRHMWAWMAGEELDPENDIHHMASVMFGAGALLTYYHRKPKLFTEPESGGVQKDRREFDHGIMGRPGVFPETNAASIERRITDPGYKGI